MREIYFDSAATTPISSEVLSAMMPVLTTEYGNSSSLHRIGRRAAKLLEKSRDTLAGLINCKSNEIYFTSGGSEANTWFLDGVAHANIAKGNHIITTKIEHHSVIDTCAKLEKEGFEVTYLNVDKNGLIDFTELMRSIKPQTIIISIIAANNEIGTIQNIKAIAQTAKEKGIIFHIDAVQLFGHMNIDVNELGIDAMSISAHKLYGPKGTGALYINNKLRISNIIWGGGQERGKRGGTVNVAGAVGFAKAAEIAHRDMSTNNYKIKKLSEYFIDQLTANIPDIRFNGHREQRLHNIISVSFSGVEGESILMALDLKGICVSTGSACASNSLVGSHVISAIGNDVELVQATVRFSISKNNTFEEIDETISALNEIIPKLRAMSPIYEKGKKYVQRKSN